ncbi:Cytochrome P450 monooxygenase FUM15 [Erysiphe neolycopersici]|uniref:Cytochrome P450 monooxygenase FUM15 n=1 Tax=Erysiphe neolycopersici TaxID=212602 RepID=A0A420HDP8_9PEZI|nr:Cytochrome P450 monooxygenase FUM15 [Erysiphe neolycopersici]
MSRFPIKEITALSAVTSYVVVGYLRAEFLPSSYSGAFLFTSIFYFFTWAFWTVLIYPKYLSPLRHLPGPEGGSWWNGQFPLIAALPTGAPMIEWMRTVPNDGIIRYLGMFNVERLFITSPNALKEVLATKSYDFVKPSQLVQGLSRLLGIGILLAEGDEHKKQRRNLLPAFSYRHIKDLYPVFWEKAVEVSEAITANVRAGGIMHDELPEYQKEVTQQTKISETEAVIEMSEWAGRATLDIIGIAGFGQDFNSISDRNAPLSQTYRIVFTPSRQGRNLALLHNFFPGWLVKRIPVKRNGEIESAIVIIRDICRKKIQLKKEKLDQGKLNDFDILSIALQSGAFSEENLIDQMMTFLAAGHETTSTAIMWAIYLLCVNPSCQSHLRAEIRANLPFPNAQNPITSSQIDGLPYLNAVCSEVLRYYPSIAMTMRVAARDTTILGHRIPKGTHVVIAPWAINKSEELWGPDAKKFKPERWLPSDSNPHPANGGAANNYSFLSFIHGPRSCIGQGFARAEFACLLAALIGRLEFTLNDKRELREENLKIKGGVTAKLPQGLFVKARVLDEW